MNLHTDIFGRYFIHSLTDLPTVSFRRSITISPTEYKSVGIFQAGIFFFGVQIPSVKPSANGFFVFPTDIATEGGITDEKKADGRNPSVMTSVKKSPTNF
jgi:hypothetical protein